VSGAVVEVVTTVATEEDAAHLARAVVEARVAACATFFPVRSVYRWEGAVQDEEEFQIIAKTAADRADAAVTWLREQHPYDTPAILVVPVLRANAEYAAWVARETGSGEAP
jgi:periplasmic divalent cation tolerance protein